MKDMIISKETPLWKLEIDGRMVEQFMEFGNYLVVNIISSGNVVQKIKTQAQKAAKVAEC